MTAETLRSAYGLVNDGPMSSNPPSEVMPQQVLPLASFFELAGPGFSLAGVAAVLSLAAFVASFGRDWLGWFVRDYLANG